MNLGNEENAEVSTDPARPLLGKFLRAKRAFKPGELVLLDQPLLHAPACRFLPSEILESAEALRAAELFVPGPESPVVSKLKREAGPEEAAETFYVRCVLHFNSFAAGVSGTDRVVFPNLSRANHSCRPNCLVDGDEGTLRALRHIEAGEELTLSYLDDGELMWPRQRRRLELQRRWDFLCGCERCTAPADDTRRFRRSCPEDCPRKGEGACDWLLAGPSAQQLQLQCSRCGKAADAAEARLLLQEEASAVRAMERAQSGDLEEEEEGQELIRTHRFADKHPTHAIAFELAHDFAFPDPFPAQRIVLAALQTVLPNLPCQAALTAGRELASQLQRRGQHKEAEESMEAAAAVACVLDGRSEVHEVLAEWRLEERRRKPGPPPPRPDRGPDLDLDLGPPKPNEPPPQKAAATGSCGAPSCCGGGCGSGGGEAAAAEAGAAKPGAAPTNRGEQATGCGAPSCCGGGCGGGGEAAAGGSVEKAAPPGCSSFQVAVMALPLALVLGAVAAGWLRRRQR